MASYLHIPFLNPLKFLPATQTPGVHFDDDWACKQIRDWETRAVYRQRWKRGDRTHLYCESSVAPTDLQIVNRYGATVLTLPWLQIFNVGAQSFYRLDFNIDALPDGVYFGYEDINFFGTQIRTITEAVELRDEWPNTMFIEYTHSRNEYDVAFTLGIKFGFRCDCAIVNYEPKNDRVSYANQMRQVQTLSGTPWREFLLAVGDREGVAPWVVDLFNRIFICDTTRIDGRLYQIDDGGKWEVQRSKGYPLIWASAPVVPQGNPLSLSLTDDATVAPGIVVAYNIDTALFGPGTTVPIIDRDEQ